MADSQLRSTVAMSNFMKSLVLCESKAMAELGPEPSTSCCHSRPDLGPFKQSLKGHFLLFVVRDIKKLSVL